MNIDECMQRLKDRTVSYFTQPPNLAGKPGEGAEYVDAWRNIIMLQRLHALFLRENGNMKRVAEIIGVSRAGIYNYIHEELDVPLDIFRTVKSFPELLSHSPVGQWLSKEDDVPPPKSQRREGRTQKHYSTRGSASIQKKLLSLSLTNQHTH